MKRSAIDLRFFSPGWQLVVMFGWWTMLFFLCDLWFEPLSEVKSFSEYYFAWAVIGVAALGITPFLQLHGRWQRLHYWSKYAIVCGLYTLLSGLILYLTILGESAGYLAPFRKDGRGSFVLLYPVVAVVYWIAGSVIGLFILSWHMIKKLLRRAHASV